MEKDEREGGPKITERARQSLRKIQNRQWRVRRYVWRCCAMVNARAGD